MTIVLQHQFWNLQVNEKYFEVELSFNDKRENLVIPFGAITGFVDPQSNWPPIDENTSSESILDEEISVKKRQRRLTNSSKK